LRHIKIFPSFDISGTNFTLQRQALKAAKLFNQEMPFIYYSSLFFRCCFYLLCGENNTHYKNDRLFFSNLDKVNISRALNAVKASDLDHFWPELIDHLAPKLNPCY
jgi:hypothetical protein